MPCTLQPWEVDFEERERNKEKGLRQVTDEELLTQIACAACKKLEALGVEVPKIGKDWWKRYKKWDKSQSR